MDRRFVQRSVWAEIEGFPGYLVSRSGGIYSERRAMTLTPNRAGPASDLKINLMRDGHVHTRSVKGLVARAFVDMPQQADAIPCDHVINKDGDLGNLYYENLDWRPLWYAMAYKKQLRNIPRKYQVTSPVVEIETGQAYENVVAAAVAHGLLFNLLVESIAYEEPTFPRGASFDWGVYS